ncbi:unnamed protein product [Cuscuta epithymum]|uniref:Pentatricopeptide repeat-containing protein n=1 Tax=Cuscuta epithymum TaxID=186058 RepID=A0AAV0G416_9ASTE|nr:unnamed protein product [Cuscuta epithymum]CAH9142525.1 unnamed protein product [Cuscuta epithymum]
MYAKCAHVDKAFHIFNIMSAKNLQSWTIMISALADNGHGEEAVCLFSRMEKSGLRPDSLSFSACGHLGLVNKGHDPFRRMASVYDIRPSMEHYGCMVDLLGRAVHIVFTDTMRRFRALAQPQKTSQIGYILQESRQ